MPSKLSSIIIKTEKKPTSKTCQVFIPLNTKPSILLKFDFAPVPTKAIEKVGHGSFNRTGNYTIRRGHGVGT